MARAKNIDEFGLSQGDYVRAALGWQYNWIALAGAMVFAWIAATAFPLLLASGFELMFLSLAPQSERFRRLVRSWNYAEEKRAHQQRLTELQRNLPLQLRQRFGAVAQIADTIRRNNETLSASSALLFARQMDAHLRTLLHGYLRLLETGEAQLQYLQTADPAAIRREIEQLENAPQAQLPKLQEINRKRIEILGKRLDKFQKISDNQQIVAAQCAAIEDVLRLIRDQSVTVKDPQQITDQLGHLTIEVEQTEQNVREMEEIFSAVRQERETN